MQCAENIEYCIVKGLDWNQQFLSLPLELQLFLLLSWGRHYCVSLWGGGYTGEKSPALPTFISLSPSHLLHLRPQILLSHLQHPPPTRGQARLTWLSLLQQDEEMREGEGGGEFMELSIRRKRGIGLYHSCLKWKRTFLSLKLFTIYVLNLIHVNMKNICSGQTSFLYFPLK